MENKRVEHVDFVRRQSLMASISRACPKCGAPGLFQIDSTFANTYPEIFRPEWAGKDVGEICPCCQFNRVPVESLGEIWSKEWRLLGVFRRLVVSVRALLAKP